MQKGTDGDRTLSLRLLVWLYLKMKVALTAPSDKLLLEYCILMNKTYFIQPHF